MTYVVGAYEAIPRPPTYAQTLVPGYNSGSMFVDHGAVDFSVLYSEFHLTSLATEEKFLGQST